MLAYANLLNSANTHWYPSLAKLSGMFIETTSPNVPRMLCLIASRFRPSGRFFTIMRRR